MDEQMNEQQKHALYWRKSLKITLSILCIWFAASFGAGILAKDWLDQFTIGSAPLGFWMAQQGSIIIFVLLLISYTLLMNRLDKQFGYDKDDVS